MWEKISFHKHFKKIFHLTDLAIKHDNYIITSKDISCNNFAITWKH